MCDPGRKIIRQSNFSQRTFFKFKISNHKKGVSYEQFIS